MRVTHTLDDLANDMAAVTRKTATEPVKIVSKHVRMGAGLARKFATKTAGEHGKLYPLSIGSDMDVDTLGGSLSAISGEWGPDSSMQQGGMSFEFGSRNQPPHGDIAKSADIVVPKFYGAVDDFLDELFW